MLSLTSRAIAMVGVLISSPAVATSDVLLEWNAIMVTTLSGQNPVEQARVAAIAQLAVFEAVNAITGDYVPYLGTVIAPRGASAEAATIAAAHGVLRNYVPANGATLDAARATSLAALPDGPGKDEGIVVGVAAAKALVDLRENDGSQPPDFYVPGSNDPGSWQLTPGCTTPGGVFLHWRNVTPFGIKSSDQFRSGRPPSLASRRYRKDRDEVTALGAIDSTEQPRDREDVARFYADVLATPLWNAVATQIATAQGRSLSENARAFALVNLAISDALVAVFETKYHYAFWRPETAILAKGIGGDLKSDSDSTFTPLITAPCHPSYPSAHASAGYAAREVLGRIYGDEGHAIGLAVATLPDVTLRYTSLKAITHDIDDARIYGGIHFRFDQQAGARQGLRVGSYVYRHSLRRAHGGDDNDTEPGH